MSAGPGRLAARLALSVTAVAVFLGAAEGVLRLAPVGEALSPSWTPPALVDHAVFWEPLDGTDNPFGVARFWKPLHGVHHELRALPGTIRIACMGGSSTYGWPFEDPELPYPAVLQRKLNALPGGRRYEVLNAGEGGFTTFQALLYLESRLAAYHPDLVTFCFGANDGSNNLEIGTTMTDAEYWDWLRKASAERAVWRLQSALSRLRTYVLVKRAVHSARVALLSHLATPRARVPPRDFEANLERFVKLGSQLGFKPVLVSEAHRNLEARFEYRAAMQRVSDRTGTPYVDVHTMLPQDPGARNELFVDEVHLTREGHERVAELLAGILPAISPSRPR